MRIAVVANTAWYLLNFRANLMRALMAQGHEIIAIAPQDAEYADAWSALGVLLAPIPLSGAGINPLRELQSVRALRQVLVQHKVQAVLSYTPKGNLYSALAAMTLSLPFVPNISGLGSVFVRKSWVTVVARSLYRLTLRRAHRVFFQNLDDMQIFVASGLVSQERCQRLPGSGVDLSRFVAQPLTNHPQDAPVFLMVARLLWDKGVGEFVQAARWVRQRHPNAEFRLLGFMDVDNPTAVPRAQVHAWEAEGLLTYLGSTSDVRPFIADADCVVLPSYREGVPRSLLEAAAMARPVITTDAPGCKDAVVHGVTGFMCRVADANDLAEKLCAFADLPVLARAAMGQAGRLRVEAEFDERRVLQAYDHVVATMVPR